MSGWDKGVLVFHSISNIAVAVVLAMFMTWCSDTGRWLFGEYETVKPVAMKTSSEVSGVVKGLKDLADTIRNKRLFGDQE